MSFVYCRYFICCAKSLLPLTILNNYYQIYLDIFVPFRNMSILENCSSHLHKYLKFKLFQLILLFLLLCRIFITLLTDNFCLQDLYCVRSDLGNLLKALGRLDEAKVCACNSKLISHPFVHPKHYFLIFSKGKA